MGLIIDLFAGGGGASLGIEWATGRSPDIAINHDPLALAMHEANHPATKHIVENVWHVRPRDIIGKRRVDILWASPDCTHFSKAKGAAPRRDINRAKRSRGLAWVILRWARDANPTTIFMENVEEWIDWCPLKKDGTVEAARKGETRKRFVRELKKLGYAVEIIAKDRACDHGAPTIRQRLFMVARCDGVPIVRPQATHAGKNAPRDLFSGPLKPYRTAAEIIDWSLECPSIFTRKKELAPATKRRIARGMKRYVIEAARPFIVPITHHGDSRVHGIDEPLRTITTAHRGEMALATPFVARTDQSSCAHKNGIHGIDEPVRTVTTSGIGAVVAPFLAGCGGRAGQSGERPIEKPMGTLTAKADQVLVTPFIAGIGGPTYSGKPRPVDVPMGTVLNENHSGLVAPILTKFRADNPGQRVDEPAPTVTANSFIKRPGGSVPIGLASAVLVNTRNGERDGQEPRARDVGAPYPTVTAAGSQGAVAAAFLAKHYGGHETPGAPLDQPVSTITTQDHHHLVAASLLHLRGSGERSGRSLEEPIPTLTTSGDHGGDHVGVSAAFLAKYYSEGGQDQSLEDPVHTLTTKARLSLVTTEAGTFPMTEEERYAAWWVARFVEDHSVEQTGKKAANTNRPRIQLLFPEERPAFVCAAGIPIVDIGMRMLSLRELYRAQGFPDSYVIAPIVTRKLKNGRVVTGPLPKTDGTRMCGNSVSPYHAAAYVRANLPTTGRARRAA